MTEQPPNDYDCPDDDTERYRRYVRAKIEAGLRQADNGETVTLEEAKLRLSRWLGQAKTLTPSPSPAKPEEGSQN